VVSAHSVKRWSRTGSDVRKAVGSGLDLGGRLLAPVQGQVHQQVLGPAMVGPPMQFANRDHPGRQLDHGFADALALREGGAGQFPTLLGSLSFGGLGSGSAMFTSPPTDGPTFCTLGLNGWVLNVDLVD
jgi:hypothetical protein